MPNQTFQSGDVVVYFDDNGQKCVSTFESDNDEHGSLLHLSNGVLISYGSVDWDGMSDEEDLPPEPSDEEMENYEEKRRRKIAEANEY